MWCCCSRSSYRLVPPEELPGVDCGLLLYSVLSCMPLLGMSRHPSDGQTLDARAQSTLSSCQYPAARLDCWTSSWLWRMMRTTHGVTLTRCQTRCWWTLCMASTLPWQTKACICSPRQAKALLKPHVQLKPAVDASNCTLRVARVLALQRKKCFYLFRRDPSTLCTCICTVSCAAEAAVLPCSLPTLCLQPL
jgi:hypothetical protein